MANHYHSKDDRKLLLRIYQRLYEAFGPCHWWPGESPFEVIIGAILTQNTAWINVEKAIGNLRDKGLLEAEKMRTVREKTLAKLIKPAGYFNLKAERIKCFMGFLSSKYDGSLERMFKREMWRLREELLGVKGIGPETADSILLYAGEKPVFVVDAYTRRMLSKLGLMDKKADYDEIQRFFMDNLSADVSLFNEFHALIVHLGKGICRGNSHSDTCPLRSLKNL